MTKLPLGNEHKLFDGAFYFLLVLSFVTGGLAIWFKGWSVVGEAGSHFLADLVLILPQIVLGVVIGALFTLLVPQRIVSRFLGAQAGLRAVLLASFLGTVMPAGPFASFPIVYALGRSGAGIGALVAFLVAWAAVGLNRLVIWEVPFMGVEFAMLRFLTSLPLPIISGIIADRISGTLPLFTMKWED